MDIPKGSICQSCSMPMTESKHFGTEADGSPSKDYCTYCYKEGKFSNLDMTMEGMVEFLAPGWGEWTQRPNMSAEAARSEIKAVLSNLKRWKT